MATVTFEWVIETMAGDEVDTDARNSLDEFPPEDIKHCLNEDGEAPMRLVLKRYSEQDGEYTAAVEDKRLPLNFRKRGIGDATYVAQRFHDELGAWRAKHLVG